MVEYINYDPATGAIHQSGSCPNEDCLPPGPDGSAWLYGVSIRDIENNLIDPQSGSVIPQDGAGWCIENPRHERR